jgi:hypothetical protein
MYIHRILPCEYHLIGAAAVHVRPAVGTKFGRDENRTNHTILMPDSSHRGTDHTWLQAGLIHSYVSRGRMREIPPSRIDQTTIAYRVGSEIL